MGNLTMGTSLLEPIASGSCVGCFLVSIIGITNKTIIKIMKVLGFTGVLAALFVIISSCNSKVEASGPVVTKKVFFDMSIGGQDVGRIEIVSLEMWFQKLSRTLQLWLQEPLQRVTRTASSIESSPTSCFRVEISHLEQELVASPFMAINLMTRTFN